MAEKTLRDAFYETLKDVYYAEKQSVRALKKHRRTAQPDRREHGSGGGGGAAGSGQDEEGVARLGSAQARQGPSPWTSP